MKRCPLFRLLLSLAVLAALTGPAWSSSFVEFLVTAEILRSEIRNGKTVVDLKVIECQDLESGYGGPPFQAGRVFKNIELNKVVKVGQVRKIKYMSYSGMTPNGPVSSETWTVQDELETKNFLRWLSMACQNFFRYSSKV